MQIRVTPGNEYELFTEQVYLNMAATLSELIKEYHNSGKNIGPAGTGCCIMEHIPIVGHGEKSVYIEYNWKNIPIISGVTAFDTGIHYALIFDEVPDEILDRYNELKRLSMLKNTA